MDRFVAWIAPARWHHWLSRAFVWLVAINVLVWLVQHQVLGLAYVFHESLMIIPGCRCR